jgi:hypothetical protein
LNVSSADQIATLQGQVADALKQVVDLVDEVNVLETANVCCEFKQLLDVGNSSDMNIGAAR